MSAINHTWNLFCTILFLYSSNQNCSSVICMKSDSRSESVVLSRICCLTCCVEYLWLAYVLRRWISLTRRLLLMLFIVVDVVVHYLGLPNSWVYVLTGRVMACTCSLYGSVASVFSTILLYKDWCSFYSSESHNVPHVRFLSGAIRCIFTRTVNHYHVLWKNDSEIFTVVTYWQLLCCVVWIYKSCGNIHQLEAKLCQDTVMI